MRDIDVNDATLFFPGYVQNWSHSMREKLRTGRPLESEVTKMLCALEGPTADAVIDFILAACQIEREDGWIYQLRAANNLDGIRDDNGVLFSRCVPDVFVVRCAKGVADELIVAVEAKRDAPVNYVSCPTGDHPDYSNQVICYVNGCWLPPSSSGRSAEYLWLARDRDIKDGSFPKHGLNGNAERDGALGWRGADEGRIWYASQTNAAELWNRASWEELIRVISPHAPGVSNVVSAFL